MYIEETTRVVVAKWLAMHNGDREALARWMARLPGGAFGIKTARQLIEAATR